MLVRLPQRANAPFHRRVRRLGSETAVSWTQLEKAHAGHGHRVLSAEKVSGFISVLIVRTGLDGTKQNRAVAMGKTAIWERGAHPRFFQNLDLAK